jgi:hypothetical protein
MSNVPIGELLRPFATSIFAKASALRHFEDAKSLSSSQLARLRESISDDIRKCTNFAVPRVSKAALREAKRLSINLTQMNWHDQKKFDPGRRTFHREHMVPVKTIRDECRRAKSEEEVLEILINRPRLVWVLKSEDAALTRCGYRFLREDPDAAYAEAGIELIDSA